MLPRPTNIRRVYVDDSKNPGTLWIGSNHGADCQGRTARLVFVQFDLCSPGIGDERDSNSCRRLAIRPVQFDTACLQLLAERLEAFDLETDVV
jgi:hypothetical protein